MADTKISALTALTGANSATGDIIPVVDVSVGADDGANKGMTRAELALGLGLETPNITALTGANLATGDQIKVYDTSATALKSMTAAEVAKGIDPLATTAILTNASVPSAPSSGEMVKFPFSRASRVVPAYRNTDSLFKPLQTSLGRFTNTWWVPAHGTIAVLTNTAALTTAGTATAASFSASAFFTSMRRVDYLQTVASTSNVAGWRLPTSNWNYTRGSSAKIGGFYSVTRWGPATGVSTSTTRALVGMSGYGGLLDVEPSTTITNTVGMGWDAADTNIQIMHNDGTGTATKIDLGASWPRPTADRTSVYEIHIYAPPNSSNVYYCVLDLVNDLEASGTISTNIPSTTQAMNPHASLSVGGTNSVIGLTLFGCYVETDY